MRLTRWLVKEMNLLGPSRLVPSHPRSFRGLYTPLWGRDSQIFGADLFVNAPSTFAPVDRAPVPADYVIGPGDQLLIRGWGTS